MKKFNLDSAYYVDGDKVYVRLFPQDLLIQDYLAVNFEFDVTENITLGIENLINEMKPTLFERFQQMENIPTSLREQFEL
jgi:hypothetical protein